MKKAIALFLALCLLLLSACGGGPPPSSSLPGEIPFPAESREGPSSQEPEPPAEKNLGHSLLPEFQGQTSEDFLAERSPEELLRYVDAAYSTVSDPSYRGRHGFHSPWLISVSDLVNFFFQTMEPQDFYCPGKDGEPGDFRIPLEAVKKQLDRCFGEGKYYYLQIEGTAYRENYDPATKTLTVPVFGEPREPVPRVLLGAKAEGDIVTITTQATIVARSVEVTRLETLRLEVKDGAVRFLSFEHAPVRERLGCSKLPAFLGKTPEDFLAERTPEELLQYMDAAYSAIGGRPFQERDGFDSPAELSSDDLFSFFFRTMDSWDFYRPGEDGEWGDHLIPLEAVTSQLDRCFGEGTYTLQVEESNEKEYYDPVAKTLTTPGFFGFGDTISRELVGAEAEGDIVTITAHTMTLDPPILPTSVETVRLEVKDGSIRFLSYDHMPIREKLGRSKLPDFSGKTSEDFLAERSPEELLQFVDAAYAAVGNRRDGEKTSFDSPSELSSEDLLHFFFRSMEGWPFFYYPGDKAEDAVYVIPLDVVTYRLDQCFGEGTYTFRLQETSCGEGYDPGEGTFSTPEFSSLGGRYFARDLVETKVEGDVVTIIAQMSTAKESPFEVTHMETLRLEVKDGNVRFLSFEHTPVER